MAESLKQNMPVRVAIVEDHADTRQSWVQLLDTHPRIQCVSACATAEAALERIPESRPQVILMDINLPGMSGIRCTALLKQRLPKAHILMLTAYSSNDCIFDALKAGASGYLLKSSSAAELIRSILEVVDGGAPMTGQIARRVIAMFRNQPVKASGECALTERETDVLELLARGYSNKEIGLKLDCSSGTVKTHLEHIYEKLHVHCRTEATAKYLGGPTQKQKGVTARL